MSSTFGSSNICGDGAGKRKHHEMTQSNSNASFEFEKAQQQFKAAQIEMERVRQQIRAEREYEPDSLLFLSDGEGHLLENIMQYFDINDLGRCGSVCHTLKSQAYRCWEALEKRLLTHPSLESPSAWTSSEMVVRYMRASSLARSIGARGNDISRHMAVQPVRFGELARVQNCCTGCDFPDINLHCSSAPDQYDLFVRVSKTSNNQLLAEGFNDDECLYGTPLEFFDHSRWRELSYMSEKMRLISSQLDRLGDEESEEKRLLHRMMGDLTVVLIAVKKSNSEASLLYAHNNFSHCMKFKENEGIFHPRGGLLGSSHGFFDQDIEIERNLHLSCEIIDETPEGRKRCVWKIFHWASGIYEKND